MRDALSKNVHNDEVTSHFGGRNEIETVTSYNEFADILDTHHVFQRKLLNVQIEESPTLHGKKFGRKNFRQLNVREKTRPQFFSVRNFKRLKYLQYIMKL